MKYSDYIKSGSFVAWQPSTWPEPPTSYDKEFGQVLKTIFEDSLIVEIKNVINDAPTLEHRGHVVALAILCAIDAVAAYAYSGGVGLRYKKYIKSFFPDEYKPYSEKIYKLYRNSIVHSWNLFEAAILPGNELICEDNGSIVFGLKNFFNALKYSINTFILQLDSNTSLQTNALLRYKELKKSAKA